MYESSLNQTVACVALVTIEINSGGSKINNLFCQLTSRIQDHRALQCTGNHTYLGLKNNRGMQSKMVLMMSEGISCSSFSVKELDVIVQKKYFSCITLLNSGHSVPHLTSEPGG